MTDLFGNTGRAYFATHPEWDYAVLFYASDDFEAFASMKANGIPSYDEGVRHYTNGNNDKLFGKRIIELDEYKAMEATQ